MLTYLFSDQNQWIGPVYSLGQLTGGLIAAFFLDKLGRKPTLSMGAFLMILSTALLVWSGGFAVVIAARVIEGVSIGFLLLGYQVGLPPLIIFGPGPVNSSSSVGVDLCC